MKIKLKLFQMSQICVQLKYDNGMENLSLYIPRFSGLSQDRFCAGADKSPASSRFLKDRV